jgi:hypothetical protein
LVAFIALVVVTQFIERVHTAISGVSRTDTLGAYPGRPSAVEDPSGRALNYLVLMSDSDRDLYTAIVLHLSADRNKLTLVALPPDIRSDGGAASLGEAFAGDPVQAWRDVESLTDTRMDHQLIVWMDKLDPVIRAMGGISLTADDEMIEASKLNGRIFSSLNKTERALRASEVMRALIGQFSVQGAISNPGQFDEVMRQLTHCIEVDQGLNSAEVESVIMGLKVNPDEIEAYLVQETPSPEASPTVAPAVPPGAGSTEQGPYIAYPGRSASPTPGTGSLDPSILLPGKSALTTPETGGEQSAQTDPIVELAPVTLGELRDSFHSDDFSALP